MTDFYEDVKERASIARSARRKINGSKSRACSLPSDSLSAAQKRKLNGEIMVYNMNAPVALPVFRNWPQDLQKQYIKARVDQFSDLTSRSAGPIFSVTKNRCCAAMREMGLQKLFFQGRCSSETADRVISWCENPEKKTDAPVEPVESALPEKEDDLQDDDCVNAPKVVEQVNRDLFDSKESMVKTLMCGEVQLRGLPADVLRTLELILASDVEVGVRLEFQFFADMEEKENESF